MGLEHDTTQTKPGTIDSADLTVAVLMFVLICVFTCINPKCGLLILGVTLMGFSIGACGVGKESHQA